MYEQLIIAMLTVALWASLLIGVLQWMVHSEKFKQFRIRTPQIERISWTRKTINISLNMLFSALLFIAAFYYFGDKLIQAESVPLVMMFGEVLASLLIYDFMYYFFHRTMHHKELMKMVHGIHHRARFPTAFESTFLHPVENFGGIFLLLFATALVGPVNIWSWIAILFIHTTANILVHANMLLPHPIFKLSNYWAQKHDYHHGKHLNKNFASIFPYWDKMFGTYQ